MTGLAAKFPAPELVDGDGQPLTGLLFTNEGGGAFRWEPSSVRIQIDLTNWPAAIRPVDALSLEVSDGWRLDRESWQPIAGSTSAAWTATPGASPGGFTAEFAVSALAGAETIDRRTVVVPVEWRGWSQFSPGQHSFPLANRASVLGHIGADQNIFSRTFRVAPAASALFQGLYSSIVFIGGDSAGYRGGLCTGMARAALERSLSGGSVPSIEEIQLWHGRQMTDRALLASALWFLAPSPRRAYHRFRNEMMQKGVSDLCFDVAVPRPLRRDLPKALTREGHTVVPYYFRQSDASRAEVMVYDPNRPDPAEAAESVMVFDLTSDTYGYRSLAKLGDRSSTVIAVRQSAYRAGRTAILAGLANLILFPRSVKPSLPSRRATSLLIICFVLLSVAIGIRRRSSLAGRSR